MKTERTPFKHSHCPFLHISARIAVRLGEIQKGRIKSNFSAVNTNFSKSSDWQFFIQNFRLSSPLVKFSQSWPRLHQEWKNTCPTFITQRLPIVINRSVRAVSFKAQILYSVIKKWRFSAAQKYRNGV